MAWVVADRAVHAAPVRPDALPINLFLQAAATAATVAPVIVAPRLLDELGLPPAAIGGFVAIVYFGAMLSGQLGGALVRRHGPIRTSQGCLVMCILGLALVATLRVEWVALGALALGCGYGPLTPASSAMLARVTPPDRYALVFSIRQTGVPLGGAMAALLMPWLLQSCGLRGSLLEMALLCAVAACLAQNLHAAMDDLRDPTAPWPTPAAATRPLRFVLSAPPLRRLALTSLVLSTVQMSLISYLVTFLHDELAWGLVAAGVLLSVAQVAGAGGRILWGLVADRLGSERNVLLALVVTMGGCGLAVPFVGPTTPQPVLLALALVYGATAIGWNGVFLSSIARLVRHDEVASATGGSLFFTYLGVVVGPPLFGIVGHWSGSLGVPFAMLALPLGAAGWMLVRARPKPPSPGAA